MTGLRDTVKALETKMKQLALVQQKHQKRLQQNPTSESAAEMERRCAALVDESKQLESERARMEATLVAHAQFATQMREFVAETGNQASPDSGSDSETEVMPPSWAINALGGGCQQKPLSSPSTTTTASCASQEEAMSPTSVFGGEETSDEDLSPDTQASEERKGTGGFYRSPKPTKLGITRPLAPVAADVRKEIGFKPLTFQAAKALVKETYRAFLNFSLNGRAISSGARVMGWEDKRLVDGTSLKFSLRKRFPGSNARYLFTTTWDCLSDPECAEQKFRGLLELRILQRVNEDTVVAMRSMLSPDGSMWFRCVYLLFRVRTRNGFLLCIQSIDPPPVEGASTPTVVTKAKDAMTHATDGRPVRWIDMSGWFMFDPLGFADPSSPSEFEDCGAQIEYGGHWNYKDTRHIAQLAMDTLSVALKWETNMVRPIFSLPPSTS
jgi:hypothetical protein